MGKFLITKRVTLGFVGDKYKDDYLEFRSIPAKEVKKLADEIKSLDEDSYEGLDKMLATLKEYFIGGSFQGDTIEKSDIDKFDIGMITKCFEIMTGQIDPN